MESRLIGRIPKNITSRPIPALTTTRSDSEKLPDGPCLAKPIVVAITAQEMITGTTKNVPLFHHVKPVWPRATSHQHGIVSSRSPSEVILQSIQDRFEIAIRQIQALPALARFSAKLVWQALPDNRKRDASATVVAGEFEGRRPHNIIQVRLVEVVPCLSLKCYKQSLMRFAGLCKKTVRLFLPSLAILALSSPALESTLKIGHPFCHVGLWREVCGPSHAFLGILILREFEPVDLLE